MTDEGHESESFRDRVNFFTRIYTCTGFPLETFLRYINNCVYSQVSDIIKCF